MVERVDAGGRTNAGLPHRSAEALFPAPDVIDEGARSRDDAADRRAETFREIDPGRIPACSHIARRYSGSHAGVQQPRAIHVSDKPVRLGNRRDFIERRLLPDRAAADIGGLLDADDGLRWLITRARMQRRTKCFRRELPVIARQRRNLESAERRMRTAFAPVQASDQTGAGDGTSPAERYPVRNIQKHRKASRPEVGIGEIEKCDSTSP